MRMQYPLAMEKNGPDTFVPKRKVSPQNWLIVLYLSQQVCSRSFDHSLECMFEQNKI